MASSTPLRLALWKEFSPSIRRHCTPYGVMSLQGAEQKNGEYRKVLLRVEGHAVHAKLGPQSILWAMGMLGVNASNRAGAQAAAMTTCVAHFHSNALLLTGRSWGLGHPRPAQPACRRRACAGPRGHPS